MGLGSGFSCVNLEVESFSSDLLEMGWYNKDNGGWFLFYWELILL